MALMGGGGRPYRPFVPFGLRRFWVPVFSACSFGIVEDNAKRREMQASPRILSTHACCGRNTIATKRRGVRALDGPTCAQPAHAGECFTGWSILFRRRESPGKTRSVPKRPRLIPLLAESKTPPHPGGPSDIEAGGGSDLATT
jgi:hypothetical protein